MGKAGTHSSAFESVHEWALAFDGAAIYCYLFYCYSPVSIGRLGSFDHSDIEAS